MTSREPLVLAVAAPATVVAGLEERGHRIAVASDGEEAIALVAEHRPAAILLGDDALGALERLPAEEVPVIVLAHGSDVLPGALARGARDCVVAPFDPAELDARLAGALRVKARYETLLDANRRLAEQALTDDLTELANRRHGEHQLEREIALAVRKGHDLGLVRVDVDHFKEINDVYGHQSGDRVLVEVARRLGDAVRGGDLLARWGGDEFVAILPATERAGVLRAAERLRAAVAAAPVQVDDAETAVTVSVGWAHWAGDTPGDLLARADRALYAAKDGGRDMVFPLRASGPQV